MSTYRSTLAICATLLAATSFGAWAQETTAPTVEDQLSLGEDANRDPELGKPYTKEVIGAWEMRCIKTGKR